MHETPQAQSPLRSVQGPCTCSYTHMLSIEIKQFIICPILFQIHLKVFFTKTIFMKMSLTYAPILCIFGNTYNIIYLPQIFGQLETICY